MNCKICKSPTNKIFSNTLLKKYEVHYHQCSHCDFIQTDEPFWLKEAYENAITSLDIGILFRNLMLSEEVEKLINYCFIDSKIYLDNAGGYGIFTRIMRDKGFNFFHEDIYCKNLFSNFFESKDSNTTHYDIVTSFEVLEHFEDPLAELDAIFKKGDSFIFTTELIPENLDKDWIYFTPETGQHISFYTTKTLNYIAKKYGFNFYSKNNFIHIFTKKELSENQLNFRHFVTKTKYRGLKKFEVLEEIQVSRKSLLEEDYFYVKSKI